VRKQSTSCIKILLEDKSSCLETQKNENLATSLPPKNSSIESSLLDFVREQSFTSLDGPNKKNENLALALKTFSDDPQELITSKFAMISTNK